MDESLRLVVAIALMASVAIAAAALRRARRRRVAALPARFDLGGLALDRAAAGSDGRAQRVWVLFSAPLCHACRQWKELLADVAEPVVEIDLRERPELAARAGIAVAPTVLLVDVATGEVVYAAAGRGPDADTLAAVRFTSRPLPSAAPASAAARSVCSA